MITTVVGSYPKVAERAYGTTLKWQRHDLPAPQLEEVYREVTRAVIKEQERAGIELLTDGQVRWDDLLRPFAIGLEGFEVNGLTRWFNNNVYYRRPILHKAPARRRPILVADYTFAAKCTKRPVKAVLPGPYTFASLSEDRHYRKFRPFVMKMAELLNAEARDLANAGAPVIQFDEPSIGFGKTDMKLVVEALNAATKGVRAKTGVSTYFGSLNGGLASLMRAKVDIVGIDVVSDPRTLSALKRVTITKELALGCLDARNTKLESVGELHTIFNVVKKRVPLDRVHINPNSGLEFLPHTQALAKVQRLAHAVRTYKG